MIEAHTTDAWTRAASRGGVAFRDATILGGFAAPLFLWLAGVGVALSAERTFARTGSRAAAADALARRGLEIFILAFLFRLQAFIVSPGGSPVMLFRVDILNVMGPAIALAGAMCAVRGAWWRRMSFAVAAAVVALVTPTVRGAAFVDVLPTWVQWYLRPAGEHTTFTFFPWIGFVFAGAAAGSLIAAARDEASERRLQVAFAIAGAALVAIGFATAARPTIYASSSFWTSSPTWFAIRLGIMTIALSALHFAPRTPHLARLGQHSLFVYWVHVELVYGYASWLWRGRLPLWATLAGCAAFSTLMYGAVVLRDRITAAWRSRQTVVQSASV
jgi:uncharacterized membrane protein